MLSNAPGQAGLSLVEVMIGLTLAGILIALALPSFRSGAQNRQIRATAEAIHNGLQVARTEALRRNRIVKFEMREANGWRVGCDPPNTTVVNGEQLCPQTLQVRAGTESSQTAEVARATVDTVTAADSGSFDDLRFTPLGRVSSLPAGSNALFRVSNPRGGSCAAQGGEMRCLAILVTTAGQIRMCDPAVAAPDPRAC